MRPQRDYRLAVADWCRSWIAPADLAIFHRFYRPPYGGGNQFLLALRGALEQRGLRVLSNTLSTTTRTCLFNSFNFDIDQLKRTRRSACRMVHRLDGPIAAYRGTQHDYIDRRLEQLNAELADATIFQSQYSLVAHQVAGLTFRHPTVIPNAVDPSIFYPMEKPLPRKIRLISTSWSSNPNKGVATYQWLDRHLDWSRYEYTFVGNIQATFSHIRVLPPQDSQSVATLLRQHDLYITASLHDPCSNALLEALSCGLPAIYARSGGHAELVGAAGLGFTLDEMIPDCVEQIVEEYDSFRAQIAIPSLDDVAGRYAEVLGLSA